VQQNDSSHTRQKKTLDSRRPHSWQWVRLNMVRSRPKTGTTVQAPCRADLSGSAGKVANWRGKVAKL
jgi:hypothetical protein